MANPSDSELMEAICKGDSSAVDSCINRNYNFDKLISFHGLDLTPLHLACLVGNFEIVRKLCRTSVNVNVQLDSVESPIYLASDLGHWANVDELIDAQADVNLTGADGASPLYIASQNGHHQVVDSLIKAQADVDLITKFDKPPLYIASQQGHNKIVELLIKANVDVNYRSCNDRTGPIHAATFNGHHHVVDLLIKAQAEVNAQTDGGESALLIASRQGYLEIVKSLIKAHADVNLPQNQGHTPLYIASEIGQKQVVNLLIDAQANVDLRTNTGESPLIIASQQGHFDVVQSLIKANAYPDFQRHRGQSAIYLAALQGHYQIVELLIKSQADVNLAQNCQVSPLFVASQLDHYKVVDLLIKAQADLDLCRDTGATPLYIASHNDRHQIVDSLIKAQADLNAQEVSGKSAIFEACLQGFHKVVMSLVRAGANLNFRTKSGESPLTVGTQQGHRTVVESLLNVGHADVDFQTHMGYTSLGIAAYNGNFQLVNTLIQANATFCDSRKCIGASPLHLAAQNGHVEIVDLLIASQADVNLQLDESGKSPLIVAASFGHCKVVQALINAQVDVNLQTRAGTSALSSASSMGFQHVVGVLIHAQADVDLTATDPVQGISPVYYAAQNGCVEVVDSLIKSQADLNIQLRTGETPIYIAAQNGHYQAVKSLIRAQAIVNLQTNIGTSPLYIASQNGNFHVVDALIKAQADVNFVTRDKEATALHIAAQNGHYQFVDLLIAGDADVNARRPNGISPLYIASQNGHHQVVESLLNAGADANLIANDGVSPLYLASQRGHWQVVKLLIQAQADTNFQRNNGASCLHVATNNDHSMIVNLLIKDQANVDARLKLTGASPIFAAAKLGHHEIVNSLLTAEADPNISITTGESPYAIAVKHRNRSVVLLLIKCLRRQSERTESGSEVVALLSKDEVCELIPVPSDSELSQNLHSALTRAGFEDSRAALQSAIADAFELIAGEIFTCGGGLHAVGSFSEGWGNNLRTLDGRTDIDSDIDVLSIDEGEPNFHIRGQCQCDGLQQNLFQYKNGHIQCPGFASIPTKQTDGSALRPASDDVSAACRLCCYPPIAPLLPERVSKSHIPQSTLWSLKHELQTSACHAVHAALHGQAGRQLRVSTTFLEKSLLRSLSTLQGQLFVTLKYLIKKVICQKAAFNMQGLKSYHVKTITFRMLEETPADEWKSENFLNLTKRSLQMLLECVENSQRSADSDGRIMDHFFLCNAGLYLKGAIRSSTQEIARALRGVIDQLPHWLMKFQDSLRPVTHSGTFYFHPFLIMPVREIILSLMSDSGASKYSNIYTIVMQSLQSLSHQDDSQESQLYLTEMTRKLPDSARSVREALRALTYLKFNNKEAAEKVLGDCRGHEVRRGIPWPAQKLRAEATREFVLQHLWNCDSAWKFCFRFDERPEFKFLSEFQQQVFPIQMENNADYFFMNFDALLQSLRFDLTPGDEAAEDWVRGVSQQEDADVQELLVAAVNCRDEALRDELMGRIERL